MKKTAYLIKLFSVTLFLLSPLIVNDYILARQPTKIVIPLVSSPPSPKASQLAKAITDGIPFISLTPDQKQGKAAGDELFCGKIAEVIWQNKLFVL